MGSVESQVSQNSFEIQSRRFRPPYNSVALGGPIADCLDVYFIVSEALRVPPPPYLYIHVSATNGSASTYATGHGLFQEEFNGMS